LNILFVADISIHKVIGGAERVLFEQSTLLQKRGHNVHVLTRKLPEHKSDHQIIHGVNEWRYDVDQRNTLLFIKSTWLNSKKLFEILHNKYKFDCINPHQPFSALGVIRSPLGNKVKKVYTCHSLSFEEFKTRNPRPQNIIKRVFYSLNIKARKFIEKKILNESDVIAVLSRFTQEKLLSAYKISSEKIVIIPGGINLQRFYPATDKIIIRRRLNIPEERLILFTVRNLVSRMGLENLLYAVKDVVEAVPDICLVLGGDGPLKNNLFSLTKELGIENHVQFVGFVPELELPDYYRMADIFILPTIELEGFGLDTLEALASGLPVLGTPVGGTIEILGKLDAKYLFKDTKRESMAALITETCREFRANPGVWQDVSSKCRLFVEENYSWEKNVKSLENLFAGAVVE